jgi:hypothetical protein
MTTATPVQTRCSLPELRTKRLPDELDTAPAPLAKIAKEYGSLHQRATEALAKAVALEASRPEAVDRDRRAVASALRVGKPDPGSKAVDALNSEIYAARREATGLVDATHETWREFAALLIEHEAAWRERLQAEQAKQITEGTKTRRHRRRRPRDRPHPRGTCMDLQRERRAWRRTSEGRRTAAKVPGQPAILSNDRHRPGPVRGRPGPRRGPGLARRTGRRMRGWHGNP